MKIKSLLVFGSMALVGVAFMSCSKDIAFDSEAATQKLVAEYDANFVKKYGAIDPNQTWDFATMTPVRSLPSTGAFTRGEGDPAVASTEVALNTSGTIAIGDDIVAWMHDNMKAGVNHSQVGSPFASVLSRNTFIIAPFYQGYATYFWELWVNIDGKEYKIWEKYKDLKYKLEGDTEWRTLDINGVPKNAVEIEAPTYTYNAPVGSQLFFFMKVWTGNNAEANHAKGNKPNQILTSLVNGNMRALENVTGLPKPDGIPSDYFAYIIGCEDGGPDKDFEDLAFLFYGPPITDVKVVEVTETKRYMMEDLGDTDDFDFNDVVVDVSNTYQVEITKKENFATGNMDVVSEEPIEGSQHQQAIVRAAGGIYNFTLEIGNTKWSKKDDLAVSTMWNTGWKNTPIDYNAELAKFDVTGWIPKDNNIILTVHFPDGDQSPVGPVQTITFPKKGTAPKMIAVDPTWNWMNEKVGVPGPGSPQPWWKDE